MLYLLQPNSVVGLLLLSPVDMFLPCASPKLRAYLK